MIRILFVNARMFHLKRFHMLFFRRFDELFGYGLWRRFLFAFYAFMIWRIFQRLCFVSHNSRFNSFLSLNNLTSFFFSLFLQEAQQVNSNWDPDCYLFVFVGVRWRFAFAFSVPDSAFCDVQCLKITKMSHVNFQFAKNKNNSVCHRGLSHLQVLKKFGVKIQIFCLKSLVSGWTF